MVMRVVRNVANTGRTVITTIHQPSKELFYMFDNLLLLQRGGWQVRRERRLVPSLTSSNNIRGLQVFFGPLGHNASELVRYLHARPGSTQRLPPDMNPGSWMLDVLAGADSSSGGGGDAPAAAAPAKSSGGGGGGGGGDLDDMPVANAALVVPLPVAASPAATVAGGAKTSFLDGQQLQEEYYSSGVWAAQQPGVEAACTAPPGARPFTFPSVYARSWGFQVGDGRGRGSHVAVYLPLSESPPPPLPLPQLYTLVVRTFVGYWRNNPYNWMRWVTFIGLVRACLGRGGEVCRVCAAAMCRCYWSLPALPPHPQMTLFGTIYYKIATKTSDFAGMQARGWGRESPPIVPPPHTLAAAPPVQSLVSVVFMGGLFIAILVMMLALPNFFKERAVFCEGAGEMYAGGGGQLPNFSPPPLLPPPRQTASARRTCTATRSTHSRSSSSRCRGCGSTSGLLSR